jgi:hypothetical protein
MLGCVQLLPMGAMAIRMAAPSMVTPWADIVTGEKAQRLTDASAAKTVLTVCGGGTLCTPMAEGGVGFMSHASYVLDDDGCPAFPLPDSQASVNLRNAVSKDGTSPASFFVHGPASTTLLGHVESFDVTSLSEYTRKQALDRSGLSDEALMSAAWHRVVPERVYFADPVRGSESWVAASDYTEATANPLAGANSELIRRLAARPADLLRVGAAFADVSVAVEEIEPDSQPARAVTRARTARAIASSLLRGDPPVAPPVRWTRSSHARCWAWTSSASTCAP